MPKTKKRGKSKKGGRRGSKFPPKWEPDKGDTLEGEVVKVEEVEFDDNDAIYMTIDSEDEGKVTLYVGACLKNQGVDDMEKGDEITLTYLGKDRGAFGARHYALDDNDECECEDDDD